MKITTEKQTILFLLYVQQRKDFLLAISLDTNIVAGSVSYLDKIYHKKRPNRDVLKAFWKEMDPQ